MVVMLVGLFCINIDQKIISTHLLSFISFCNTMTTEINLKGERFKLYRHAG